MRSPLVTTPRLVTALASLLLAACGDPATGSGPADGTGADSDVVGDGADEGDIDDFAGKSIYELHFTVNGTPIDVTRDLTGLDQYFAFGSTHIAPAVSFGMTDSIQFPRTMTIGINFGIVVPSADHAIQTEGAGTHPFSAEPPSVELFVSGLQYRSTLDGASGAIVVTDWGVDEGELVAGTFEGTLVAEGTTGRTVDVTGRFHFILPAKNAGQPQ